MWLELATKALKSRWLPWSLLLAVAGFSMHLGSSLDYQKIATQNAVAARDSTRSISTKHGEVYARIIAQKDVELGGALATVAHLRRLHPVAALPLVITVGGVDTTATHGTVGGNGQSAAGADSTGAGRSIRDSLVFTPPPIGGVVTVDVRDSTIYWTARLKPAPVPLTLSLGCGKDGPEVTASGPSWVATEIKTGQVDPKVCNPPSSKFWTGVKWGAGITAVVVVAHSVLHLF